MWTALETRKGKWLKHYLWKQATFEYAVKVVSKQLSKAYLYRSFQDQKSQNALQFTITMEILIYN